MAISGCAGIANRSLRCLRTNVTKRSPSPSRSLSQLNTAVATSRLSSIPNQSRVFPTQSRAPTLSFPVTNIPKSTASSPFSTINISPRRSSTSSRQHRLPVLAGGRRFFSSAAARSLRVAAAANKPSLLGSSSARRFFGVAAMPHQAAIPPGAHHLAAASLAAAAHSNDPSPWSADHHSNFDPNSQQASAMLQERHHTRHDAPVILTPKQMLRQKALLQFDVGTAAYPHPHRVRTGSEDAFFTSRRTANFVSSGVADGVAAVRRLHGLDPSRFSRGLCDGAHHFSNEKLARFSLEHLPSPDDMFDAAIANVKDNDVKGCATLCLVTLNGYLNEEMQQDPRKPAGELQSVSLGDSQYVVIHTDDGLHKSAFQQHAFGHPYQLGHGKGLQHDSPDLAARDSLPIYRGDTVIIGSDGLFDNVHDEELLSMTVESNDLQRSAGELAAKLANYAYSQSTDRLALTPYAEVASRKFDQPYSGGNRDDITVVVAKVHNMPNSIF